MTKPERVFEKYTKVIFMGTPDTVLPLLQALIDDPNIEICAVVTQEDKKVGRKQIVTSPPVKNLALQHNLPVLQPASLKENWDFFTLIKQLQPDFIVTAVYGNILPKELLEIPRYFAINFHPSLLPKYRGTSPVASALLNGDRETGITFIKMDAKLDSGNILFVKKIPIEPHDNTASLRVKLALIGAKFLPRILQDIEENNIQEIPQNESEATYCGKIKKSDGLISLSALTAEEIFNRVRAYNPWPMCFLFCGEKRLKFIEADFDNKINATPWSVVDLTKNSIGIGTKKGLLIPKTVQLEGKKPMPIQEFLAGNRELLKKLLVNAK